MRDYAALEHLFIERLGLERRPIAISFPDSAPSGVTAFSGAEPAGCGFWRLAAGGQTFYTKPEDHYNCPIGSYTHNMPLPAERQPELDRTLGLMADIGYLRWEEVPGIARLKSTPAALDDAVAGGGVARGRGRRTTAPRAAYVHGPSSGARRRHGSVERLHRESRLH